MYLILIEEGFFQKIPSFVSFLQQNETMCCKKATLLYLFVLIRDPVYTGYPRFENSLAF